LPVAAALEAAQAKLGAGAEVLAVIDVQSRGNHLVAGHLLNLQSRLAFPQITQ